MGESVPLLPERMAARGGREVKLMNGGGATGWWRDLAREGGKVGRVALPMAAVSLSQYAVQVASNMMDSCPSQSYKLQFSQFGLNCLTTITLMYTIPYGLGAAASTRVANELGAGNPEGARSAVRIVMTIAALEASIITSSLLASQHIVGYAYSSDKEVVSYVNAMVPFVCVSVAADSLQGVLSGIARGSGWQHLGAYVNLGSFYLVGIPTALFLGFVLKMEGKGLWMGISCGSVVQFLLLAVITFFSNWPKMSEKARERVFSEELSDKEALESDGSVSV
ncbi:hypothetical protein QOZ80_5AG0363940 [Eleusine coracana subsp. coracana]|nr:hypothetical protein QOZ80_5AG0363940 [Eleusine coracana subsp. coracana]